MIKDENMSDADKYAELIKIGNPWFVEIKSYMWVGESQKQYKVEDMPAMAEIREFADNILKFLPEYEFADEHLPSRVVLLVRKDIKDKRFIEFGELFEN